MEMRLSKVGREHSRMLSQIWALRSIDTSVQNIDDVTDAIRKGWYLLSVTFNGRNPVFGLGSTNPEDNPLKDDPTWQGRSRSKRYAAIEINRKRREMIIQDLDQPGLEVRHIGLEQSRSAQTTGTPHTGQPTPNQSIA